MGAEFHYEMIDTSRQLHLQGFEGPSRRVTYNTGVGTMVQTTDDLILIRVHEGLVTDQK